jgi:DsbC/DsbD-like thiol-disulfide interchange protein
MKSMLKPLLIAGLLATAGLTAFSQSPMDGMSHDRMDKAGHMDRARMQAQMNKKNAALKAQLKLSAAQEAAWLTFVDASKPPADMMARQAQHAELAKLPTPERIDQMKTLRSQHMAEMTAAMDKRGEATKAFYATLTAEQKKTFDSATTSHHGDKAHKGHMGPAPAKP